jgi:hypothetical protein
MAQINKRRTGGKMSEPIPDMIDMMNEDSLRSHLRDVVKENTRLRAENAEAKSQCPSCRCGVDKNGDGHHSTADCIFMKRLAAKDALLREVAVMRDECRVAQRDLLPVADPTGDARMTYGICADRMDKILARLREGEEEEA